MVSLIKELSEGSLNLCRLCLQRIDETKTLNAFITILRDEALSLAAESDQRTSQGIRKSKLDGYPIAVKDNFCTLSVKTTCASKMLQNFVAPYDATAVRKLKEAGAIILGKTNLDEFAMGSGTVDSLFGPTRNVWGSPLAQNFKERSNTDTNFERWRISGGSSGGSAIAVATGAVFAALGSDTGGSTRNPASYCGITGFKPTYGVVSRHGLIPLVNSMDVPGILARKVEDVADIFNIICGPDNLDSTTIEEQLPLVNLDQKINIENITVGIPKEYYHNSMALEVSEAWQNVATVFRNAGAKVKEISLPHTESSIVTYSVLNQCEVASNMARYSGLLYGLRIDSDISTEQTIAESRWQGFGPVVKARILAGNYFLLQRNYEKYFVKAMKVRRLIANDFKNVWSDGVDVILSPTTLTTAPLLSEFIQLDNRAQCSAQDYCTQPANMAGCPAISLPICLSQENLPISLQLIGRNYEDAFLLRIAHWLQSVVSFPHLILQM